jgi:hypothetical protein
MVETILRWFLTRVLLYWRPDLYSVVEKYCVVVEMDETEKRARAVDLLLLCEGVLSVSLKCGSWPRCMVQCVCGR